MNKKIVLGLLVFVILFTMTGCGKKEENKEQLSVGWKIATEFESYLPIESVNLFYKTTTEANEQVIPIALLGKQVVSGTNYMFLVQKDNEYYVYIIYKNLENKTSITNRTKFDLTKYTHENKLIDSKTLVGGWKVEVVEEDIQSMTLDEKTQKIFEKASEKLTGETYYPITVLGKQIVSGINYAVIAYGTPSTKELVNDSNKGVYILTLYEDLNGTCEIISSSYIDLSEYNKYKTKQIYL